MNHDRETGTVAPEAGDDNGQARPQPDDTATDVGLEAARAEIETLREQHLRAVAELENVRRRAARDVENAHRYGIERFASELLAVADSMEMGLQAIAEDQADGPVAQGFRATLKQLGQCLERFGITPIDPLGETFDPELHEAMTTQPAPDKAPGSVLAVIQKGYRIHDRLLRAARVIVVRAEDEPQS